MTDIVRDLGYLFLGTRLKRLGERLQADVARMGASAGIPIQPSQSPIMAAIDRAGPQTISDLVRATGVSQPAITRAVGLLTAQGLVELRETDRDRRHKTIALTEAGIAAMQQAKRVFWPQVEAAAVNLCATLQAPLLAQLAMLEDALAALPLDQRFAQSAMAGLSIREFSPELARNFHDINVQWITQMFRLEQTDRDVLEDPQARIIAPGGDILFVHADGIGIVGTCALKKTGDGEFELTKMGVLDAARGQKAGEFLLWAVLRRARELGAKNLYLLTSKKCAAAIHLYEKLGFQHDAAVMRDFGARYERCDVAMRYRPTDGRV